MRKVIIGILMFFCLLGVYQSLWANHSMHPLKQIAFVKKMIERQQEPYHTAYVQLIRYADSIQHVTHHARNDFAVPGYYVKPEEHRTNSLALQQDAFAAYCSALAYRLSGKKRYGEKACYFMNAWATINKKYSEPDGPLVMSYSGSAFLMAAELMDDMSVWDADEKRIFKDWVTSVYRKATNEIRERKNNWADWGRLGSLLAASFLNDKEEIATEIMLRYSENGLQAKDGNYALWYANTGLTGSAITMKFIGAGFIELTRQDGTKEYKIVTKYEGYDESDETTFAATNVRSCYEVAVMAYEDAGTAEKVKTFLYETYLKPNGYENGGNN